MHFRRSPGSFQTEFSGLISEEEAASPKNARSQKEQRLAVGAVQRSMMQPGLITEEKNPFLCHPPSSSLHLGAKSPQRIVLAHVMVLAEYMYIVCGATDHLCGSHGLNT